MVAWRYGNPARGLKIIAVAGAHGKSTVATLLGEVLQEAGSSVAVFTNQGSHYNGKPIDGAYDLSAEALQRNLMKAKRRRAYYVVLEVTDELAATHALGTLPIEMSVITGDSPSAQVLLQQPVNSTVIPAEFDVTDLKVDPHQAISFGKQEPAEACIAQVTERRRGTEIELIIDHQTRITLATYLIGYANALNVAAAVSAAYVLAVNKTDFQEGIARLERMAGNYDYVSVGELPYEVAVDAATDTDSIELVLATAKKLKKRRLLVVADSRVATETYPLLTRFADRVTVVGEAPEIPGVEFVTSKQEAVDITLRGAKKDDLVLLLGADFAEMQADGLTKAHYIIKEKQATDE